MSLHSISINKANLILLSILFLISYILTYVIRIIAIKKSIIDIPNERSSHSVPTPRGGGLAIFIAWFVGITFLFIIKKIPDNLFYALLSGIILTIVGLFDDVYSLRPTIRFIFQIITAFLALYFLGGFNILQFENTLVSILSWIIVPIGIVWYINLYNFLDGIDAYASLEAIFLSFALYLFTGDIIFFILIASTLGFLIWNWPKAKIFMGDVGSTQLGFILIILGIYNHNTLTIDFKIWLMLSSVFWFDATYTLIRRFINKEKLSQAHKKHIYQRAVLGGLSHLKVSLFALLLNISILFFIMPVLYFNLSIYITFFINILLLVLIAYIVERIFPFRKKT